MGTSATLPVETAESVTTSASALLGMQVLGAAGQVYGRVWEIAVDVERDGTRVAALIVKGRKGASIAVTVDDIAPPTAGATTLRALKEPGKAGHLDEMLLLDRDLLDQQIIDVDGHKVVRVNDVNLMWELPAGEGKSLVLRMAEVEVGLRGAARRMLKGLPQGAVEGLSNRLSPRVIPWEFVDLIERDPARRVKLKIDQQRLSKLHPSDIAAILEELAPAEREAIFSSLPEETAAETLEEVAPKLQRELVEGLDSEKAADIIEEMDPAAAADLLAELSDEQSEAILEEMEPEERHDVEELLEHEETSAAGRMTTDFVIVQEKASVFDAVAAVRSFEGDADTITEVYLLDDNRHLRGVVPLARLLIAASETPLREIIEEHRVSCGLHAKDAEVAELFDKYNLRSLPVVDAEGRLAGTIHAEQVIAQLLEG